jgi:hypothetical protein
MAEVKMMQEEDSAASFAAHWVKHQYRNMRSSGKGAEIRRVGT